MKFFVVGFLIFFLGFDFNDGIELKCKFETGDWYILDEIYNCESHYQGDIITERNNREITSIAGKHEDSKTNDDVKGVWIDDSNVFYFPRGLLNFFPNLEGIEIRSSNLTEITKEDLRNFTNLRNLDLDDNKIQVLEKNLFENNPKLEYFSAARNQISHINSNVFNNFVNQLSFLYLSGNICEFEDAWYKGKANQIIEKIQSGYCKDESKLPQTTTTTTTPKTTTITTPKTTTTTPKTTTTTTTTPKTTTTTTTPSVTPPLIENFKIEIIIFSGFAIIAIVIATILFRKRQKRIENLIYARMNVANEEVNIEMSENLEEN